MRPTLAPRTRRRLDIQGFDPVDEQVLAPVAPWLRLAFDLCALLGGVGTRLGVSYHVGTTDSCIPSMIYRSIFGRPQARDAQQQG